MRSVNSGELFCFVVKVSQRADEVKLELLTGEEVRHLFPDKARHHGFQACANKEDAERSFAE